MKSLSELIKQAEEALNALAQHPDYCQLQDADGLMGLDVTQGDCLLFLSQLSQAYEDYSLIDNPTALEMGQSHLTFEELFGEEALQNPLHQLEPEQKPRKLTLTEIMQRPLPPITPEMQAELDELEQLFGNK